jgi:hypothetical protein
MMARMITGPKADRLGGNQMITLSAPAKSGYTAEFESIEDAQAKAAELLGCSVDDMIEVLSPDGGTIYCYATQKEADSDQDGAYAVQYSGGPEEFDEPDHDDSVKCCPDCDRPNQFGELCAECQREREIGIAENRL